MATPPADDRHEQRVSWSLRHPARLSVNRATAVVLPLLDAHGHHVFDWHTVQPARPHDRRWDEPPPRSGAATRVANRQTPNREKAYVQALLRGAYDDAAHAQPGERNNTLSRSAFRYGQVVGAGLLDETAATNALEEAAHQSGLPRREATATIRGGLRAGQRHPLQATK
jgi:hypothetical protein